MALGRVAESFSFSLSKIFYIHFQLIKKKSLSHFTKCNIGTRTLSSVFAPKWGEKKIGTKMSSVIYWLYPH